MSKNVWRFFSFKFTFSYLSTLSLMRVEHVMTNAEKITELQMQVLRILQDIEDNRPDRLSIEDVEDVSDNYQANLEYGWYVDEQREIISALQEDIVALQSLHPSHTYNDPAIAEIEWPIVGSDGLRYVSAEVGYVDQDEEYM